MRNLTNPYNEGKRKLKLGSYRTKCMLTACIIVIFLCAYNFSIDDTRITYLKSADGNFKVTIGESIESIEIVDNNVESEDRPNGKEFEVTVDYTQADEVSTESSFREHMRGISSGEEGEDNTLSFKRQHYDVCIAGAGLSGAVIAEQYASQLNQSVLVIEKRDHIAGNCFDYTDKETGIRVSKYGAHLFHTNYDRVWEYVQQFSEWTKYEHEVRLSQFVFRFP